MTDRKKENQESVNKRNKKFSERMKDRGLVYLCLWVPKEFKEKVKELVKSFSEEFK